MKPDSRIIPLLGVLLFGLFLITSADFLPAVSFQVHSYNDLREWPQALIKGATWFKVDPNFQNATFCASQQRVSDPSSGCFILNHDDPDPSDPSEIRYNYNTTQDILNFISDQQYSAYFAGNTTIYIALCFKTDFDVCGNSTDAENWNSQIEAYVKQADKLISSNKLNVQFILDGQATANDQRKCLKDSFKPWVFTYIVTQDPIEALVTNDPIAGYDRFAVNDIPADEVDTAANLDFERDIHYGKFKDSKYPFLFWEPSKQSEFLSTLKSYSKGDLAPAGFRFAINVDPVQMQVYASPLAGVAGNFKLDESGSDPLVAVFDKTTAGNGGTGLGVYVYQVKNTTYYVVFDTSSLPQNITILTEPQELPLSSDMLKSTPTSLSAATDKSGSNLLFVSDASANYAVLQLSNNVITLVSSGDLGKDRLIRNSQLAVVTPESGDEDLMFFQAYSKEDGSCGVALQAYQINSKGSASRIGGEQCIADKPAFTAEIGFDVTRNLSAGIPNCAGQVGGLLAYADDKKIYSAYFCFFQESRDSYKYIVSGPTFTNVGSKPSISLRPFGNDVGVAQVQSEGYCYNNVIANKRPAPGLCDSEPQSLSHVLTYNFGLLSQFAATIDANETITACGEVLHGMYDMGSNPAVSLFVPTSPFEELSVVEIHEGVSRFIPDDSKDKITSDTCGNADAHDGLVVDSIPLPTFRYN
jgi:hypothetical protein